MKKLLLSLCLLIFWGYQTAWAETSPPGLPDNLPPRWTNSLGMEFILVPAGPFRFGYGKDSAHTYKDHIVWLSKPYYLQNTEVTQQQWQALMNSTVMELCKLNPEPDACQKVTGVGPQYPLYFMTHKQAHLFIQRLNQRENLRYRLPTETEWAKAAQAGTWRANFWWGERLNDRTHLYENCLAEDEINPGIPFKSSDGYYKRVAPVASFQANTWGFYDMQGNVSELTANGTGLWTGTISSSFGILDKQGNLIPARIGVPTMHENLFVRDIHEYIQDYTDYPHDWEPGSFKRAAMGGNYLNSLCNFVSNSRLLLEREEIWNSYPGMILDREHHYHEEEISAPDVGLRLLLEADSVLKHLQAQR
ncbi:MAG: formylglycine-generating enzyme family protein [Candidatus Sericytochromatia bacterium]